MISYQVQFSEKAVDYFYGADNFTRHITNFHCVVERSSNCLQNKDSINGSITIELKINKNCLLKKLLVEKLLTVKRTTVTYAYFLF